MFGLDGRFQASAAVYQIDSLNRTLHRSLATNTPQRVAMEEEKRGQRQVELKLKLNMTIDDRHFSNLIVDTGVGGISYRKSYLTVLGTEYKELYQVELGCP